ncbi:inositol monophosphatase family protein [Staphylococcus schweitzeri]|uniref:inositol monophosphatase family protein n=1 Tax=Staphylococcus schweitzeri TaxID=1654388 RepID=UPI0005054F2B|nr:inositol monophosphatase family protein [Staphylococcus schweitzeri]CDR66956.1 inositol monophosphatase family protein [Staphylococcus schweitzeri]
MTDKTLQQIDTLICSWLKQIDNVIPQLINEMTTETKRHRFDLVTNVDKQIQQQFQTFLCTHFPEHELLAEEKSNDKITKDIKNLWIMDPIDGTANLVKQQEDYCIILAYFVEGTPMLSYIYDYPHKQLYKAIRGVGAFNNDLKLKAPEPIPLKDAIVSFNAQVMNMETVQDLFNASFSYRLVGACGLDSIRVAKGQFGAHINTNPKPWDIAAQFLFAELLNLKMTSLNGDKIDYLKGGPFIISNVACHQKILEILNTNGGYKKLNSHV